jgi:hypothetical protein
MWNVDTNDWRIGSEPNWQISNSIGTVDTAIKTGSGGFLSLEHELKNGDLAVAGPVIDLVQQGGFKTVSVAECDGGSDSDAYMEDDSPFNLLLNTIIKNDKPFTPEPPRPTSLVTAVNSVTSSSSGAASNPKPNSFKPTRLGPQSNSSTYLDQQSNGSQINSRIAGACVAGTIGFIQNISANRKI